MKLAFEHGYMRDCVDEDIKKLPVEYYPTSISDAYKYINDHRNSKYLSINFDPNLKGALAIDYGSHVEFCYIWDIEDNDFNDYINGSTKEPEDSEEIAKRKFARDVLNKLKNRHTLTYEEAVAISKVLRLGGE